MAGASRGRESKLTPAVHKSIIKDIAAGLSRHTAVGNVGVSYHTLHRWLAKGAKQATGHYCQFRTDLKKAEARATAVHAATIRKAAVGWTEKVIKVTESTDPVTGRPVTRTETTTKKLFDWTAAAWWLERRVPEDYSSDRKRVKELERLLRDLQTELANLKANRGLAGDGKVGAA